MVSERAAFGAAGACIDVSVSETSASVAVSALNREVCGSSPSCIDAGVKCVATIEMCKRLVSVAAMMMSYC